MSPRSHSQYLTAIPTAPKTSTRSWLLTTSTMVTHHGSWTGRSAADYENAVKSLVMSSATRSTRSLSTAIWSRPTGPAGQRHCDRRD